MITKFKIFENNNRYNNEIFRIIKNYGDEYSLLHNARSLSMYKLLIENGADVNNTNNESKQTTIMFLLNKLSWLGENAEGTKEVYLMIEYLLDNGADVNIKENRGRTFLDKLYDSKQYIYNNIKKVKKLKKLKKFLK